ncbi:MAG: rod shape-determining protein RodA, partial [Actinomyces sp.]
AGIRFQPSEPGKLVAIVALAWILSSERLPLRRLAAALASVGLLVALILLQPDLGTVLVYVAVTVALVVVSGVRARVIVALALVAATGTFAVFQSDVLADYQKARLTIFLFDEEEVSPDLAPYAYNAEQAQIAIGNGGLTGQGLFQGTQTRSDLVPEQQTDFIFTVAGEELGFRGAGLLLGLFGLLVFRIWRIAMRARDRFDRLIAVGVMVMFLFQIFQSVGMTMGMMPVTGIPLPLVSYGGSSMITSLVALGLVAGVHRRRFS